MIREYDCFALVGPTASGKTSISIKIAKKINGEIINADSMQIYKEFSILSSRPRKEELKKIKHHLYGIISVKKYFSAGDWLKEAKKKINACIKKKKTPIIVGGLHVTNRGTIIPSIVTSIFMDADRLMHQNSRFDISVTSSI